MHENTVPAEFTASGAPVAREGAGGPADVAAVEQPGGLNPDAYFAAIRRFVDGVKDVFTARTVYGEAIEAHGVTVIPVAQTYFGMGVGGGVGRGAEPSGQGLGGGGGAGGVVRPIGFIEITASGARWVPITRPWQRVTMGVLPPVLALLAGRIVRRRLLTGPREG